MSEINNNARTNRTLTYEEFYRCCELMKRNKDWFLAECPTLEGAAVKLSELAKIEVSTSSVRRIQKATNVLWVAKVDRVKNITSRQELAEKIEELSQLATKLATENNNLRGYLRTVTICLTKLYSEAGSKVPLALANMESELTGK